MARYELSVDTDSQVILWRLPCPVPDAEIASLERELLEIMAAARTVWGRVRMLVDIHEGSAFASPAMTALAERMRRHTLPGDRRALLVAQSLHEVAVERWIAEDTGTFLSETAAMTWLTAWDELPLPVMAMCRP